MSDHKHPTVAKIDLTAFKENILAFQKRLGNAMLLAVVKTNAYGHGILEVSRAAVEAGVDRLGTTSVEEGILLRKNGIKLPIQLLSAILPEQVSDIVAFDLIASVSTECYAQALSKAAIEQNKVARVHLKIDTGLHRFGIEPAEAIEFCNSCYDLPRLEWEGIYTHFSSADDRDWVTTEKQFYLFMNTVSELNEAGFIFSIHHAGGSTIAIERADMYLDMVRPGIALFGYPPTLDQEKMITLKPVMKLTTKILQIKNIQANTPVGYGGNYRTKSPVIVALLPLGHGDGYKKALSNKGEVLVKGRRAKIVGTISLDQTIIDVSHIPNVNEGDEAVLIGSMGNEAITARDMAYWLDSIVDEVVSSLMPRITRTYD